MCPLTLFSSEPKIHNIFNAIKVNDIMSTTVQRKTYSVVITKDDDGIFVGRCEELHANSQGVTFGIIIENMKEAVELAAEELGHTTDFDMLIMER